jgi:hypothetical protein
LRNYECGLCFDVTVEWTQNEMQTINREIRKKEERRSMQSEE